MKKIFLAAFLFMTIAAFNYNAKAITGDVDGDGIVTSVDITILYNYLLDGTTEGMVNGDQDGDGIITDPLDMQRHHCDACLHFHGAIFFRENLRE